MHRVLLVMVSFVALWPIFLPSVARAQSGLSGSFFWEERAFAMNYPLYWGPPTEVSDTRYAIASNDSDIDSLTPSELVLTIEYLPADSLNFEDTGNTFGDLRDGFSEFARVYAATDGLALSLTIDETDYGYIGTTSFRGDLNIKVALVLAGDDAFALKLVDPNATVSADEFARVVGTVLVGEAALEPPQVSTFGTPLTLIPGEAVVGTISDRNYEQAYVFTAEAGQFVTVRMVAADSDLDPLLVMYADREQIAYNDDVTILVDGVGEYDALVGNVELPPARLYTIVATRYSGIGDYTLTLTVSDVSDPSTWFGDLPIMGLLTLGTPATGSIMAESNGEVWRFMAEAGDVVTVDMIAAAGSTLDPYLLLFDAQGNYLAGANDSVSGDSLNAKLEAIELPADGEYILLAFSYAQSTGDYELIVTVAP